MSYDNYDDGLTDEDYADFAADDWRHRQEEAGGTLCPECGGSGLSPYDDDGGCPHCFGGHTEPY